MTMTHDEDEKTLVTQLEPDAHSTWPAPPLSPVSTNPPASHAALTNPSIPRSPLQQALVALAEDEQDLLY